jgi:hypothetical protein
LAPGAAWFDWTGYQFVGARAAEPGTVVVLVRNEAVAAVKVVGDVVDERAVWLELPASARDPEARPAGGTHFLVLAAYGPQAGQPVAVRRAFWEARGSEVRQLRAMSCYRGWQVLLVGDVNVHFPEFTEINRKTAGPLDRKVLAMIRLKEVFLFARFSTQVAHRPIDPDRLSMWPQLPWDLGR